MKKIFSFSGMALVGLSVILLFCRVDCSTKEGEKDPVEEDLCGPQIIIDTTWILEADNLSPEAHFSYIQDGKAVYSYILPTKEKVCAHKHLSGSFSISIRPDYVDQVTQTAEVVYGFLYSYPITKWDAGVDELNNTVWISTYNFGIKHVYGDEPGWFFPVFYVGFEDQGSEELNNDYFENAVRFIKFWIIYFEWKDNSGGAD